MTAAAVLAGVELRGKAPEEFFSSEVQGLAYDSRKVKPGFLFWAFPGSRTDGSRFAQHAIEQGALAVLSEATRPSGFQGLWLQVPHGRATLATAARNFYEKPDTRLRVSAITGTNGKTTSALLLEAILQAGGYITGLVGTISYHLAGRVLPAVNTTPESLDLFSLMRETEQAGGTHFVFEASSHALDLGRIHGVTLQAAGWTNFTRDHLDYHETMEAYFAAKQLLFRPREGSPPRFAVLNAADEGAHRLSIAPETQVIWYGDNAPRGGRTVAATNVEGTFEGLRFDLTMDGSRTRSVGTRLVGHINVANILLAAGMALANEVEEETIIKGIESLTAVPGRFERVEEGQPFLVVVDYAHTDDALRNVLAVARQMKPARIITLFGCGGDRDRSKRPLMGRAAAEGSDFVVLTSDNPRSEDPLAIMNDVTVGLNRGTTAFKVEPDRERAIRLAIGEARPRDIVVLAGKGHETYQVLRDGPVPFDDREVARRVLHAYGYGRRAKPAS